MLKEERQQEILNQLYKDGKVNVNDLATFYQVSKDTIRRDLNELEQQGVIKRGYGGAIPSKRIPLGFDSRIKKEENQKYKVAQKALHYVQSDSVIAIDGGTTNLYFASLLPRSMKLTVATNSFPIAEELRTHPYVQTIFLGGLCNKESQVTTGKMVMEQIQNFHFDQCFLGVYGIDSFVGASVPSPYEDEADIKRWFVKNSDVVNVMASLDKLDVVSNYVICEMDRIHRILCDGQVDTQRNKKYQNKIV